MFRRIYKAMAFAMAMMISVGLGGASIASAAASQPPASQTSNQPHPAQAVQSFLLEAEALYEAANSGGDGAEIARRAARTEARLRMLPMEGIATAEGIESLARSVARMKRLAAAVSPDPEKIRTQAAEIRLAADAIAHPQAPMWHRYSTIVQDDLQRLGQAIGQPNNAAGALAQLHVLQSHYQLIRTAILIHAETYKIEQADSVLRYAERVLGAKETNPAHIAGLMPPLQDAFGQLFPARDESTSSEPIQTMAGAPWGWSAFMGVFIVAVLSWVGWLRYREPEPVSPRGSLPPAHRGRR